MIAYLATKEQFLIDAPSIADVVRDAVRSGLGIRIAQKSSEFRSWENSLGNAMFHVLNSAEIASDVGVAVEYRPFGGSHRIDVMVSGFGDDGGRSVVIVELKQWTEVQSAPLVDHVTTYLGGSRRMTRHPSYQAWSYGGLLSGFCKVVASDPIRIQPCAYVHNCRSPEVLRDASMQKLLDRAPVFIHGEHSQLRRLIAETITVGDLGDGVRRIENSAVTPSAKLVTSLREMLNGSEEFILVDEQKTAFEMIMNLVTAQARGTHFALMVRGGPGTGKSVIAINALVKLLNRKLNVRYVTKNAAPRTVYKSRLQGDSKLAEIESLFVNSGQFHNVPESSYDVLLVDEAHRLTRKSGIFGNLGENQIAELMRASKVSVFFVDDDQLVTWKDIGTSDEIASQAMSQAIPLEVLELTAQFRCAGSDEYLKWVDSALGISDQSDIAPDRMGYDVQVLDSPTELRDLIFDLNQSSVTARLLAGYCWPWASKEDPGAYDIVFPDAGFNMRWNLQSDGMAWLISPNSVEEVGCIYTSQGLEADYMGVIIGPDLLVRNGEVVVDPSGHAPKDRALWGWKSAARVDRKGTMAKVDRLIRNTYRTLLTRGMRGTYIYCTDAETREYFKGCLEASRSTQVEISQA